MSRRINTLFTATALAAASSFVTAAVINNQQDHANDQGIGFPEDFMANLQAYRTPGRQHKEMAKHAGTWDMTAKMWMDPDAPPQASEYVATMQPIMGGRYMLESVEGKPGDMMPDMTYRGMNIMGYDNHKQVYTYAWFDNMGTGIFTGEGSANADGSVITYMSQAPDLENPGQMKPVKSVTRNVNEDKIIFEMYEIDDDGEWWKNFESVYTRADVRDAKMTGGYHIDRNIR